MNRPVRLLLAGALIASCAVAGCGGAAKDASCGSDESVVSSPSAVFGPVGGSDDRRLERLAKAASGWGLGTVAGGVGYDYGQWLSLGGLSTGVAAWTKRDAVISFLGEDLAPRWGLRQAKVPHAWTADTQTFYELELSTKHPMWLSAYRLSDGHREWCATVGDHPTRQDDPYGTAFAPGGSLLVLSRGGTGSQLTALGTDSGKVRWRDDISGIDRGDFIGDLGNGLALVGGRASYEVGDARHPSPDGTSLAAVDEETGRVRWRFGTGEIHVVGRSAGVVVVEQTGSGGAELVGLGTDGKVRWRRPVGKLGADLATAGSVVIANTGRAFVGIDARTGHRMWSRSYPRVPQYLPYGFVLAAQPMLDPRHVLIGGTTGLHALDIRTGRVRTFPLPVDGINTTYWPYQLVLTDHLLAVVTNTGSVVLRR
ncbi:MAG TPA: PQQ-binding-like beta-propeller repeat protein [Marmoricola sp.]